jgi:hypothetical protein
MHVAHLEDTPLNYAFKEVAPESNRKLKPIPRLLIDKA